MAIPIIAVDPKSLKIQISNNARPAKTRPVDTAIDTSIIINLVLYLKTFLNEDLYLNANLFQISGIFSIKILFPDLGTLGLSKVAGSLFASFIPRPNVTNNVTITIMPIDKKK